MNDFHGEAFFEEAQELLSSLESSLLELEKAPQDQDLIDRVFRALHTVKGSGAMFGFDSISDFTHHVESVFDRVRSRVLTDAPEAVRRGCHLQGNEFNVTMKPNAQTGSDRARAVIDETLVYMLDLLADCLGEQLDTDTDPDSRRELIRAYYADSDPEIREVLEDAGELPTAAGSLPDELADFLDRIDLIYYEADAVEIGSLELNKVTGVRAALDVLGIDDPFCLVMGDSKTDLRLMEWVETDNCGIAAAPAHASQGVLDHVAGTDELVYDPGEAAEILVTVATINRLATLSD